MPDVPRGAGFCRDTVTFAVTRHVVCVPCYAVDTALTCLWGVVGVVRVDAHDSALFTSTEVDLRVDLDPRRICLQLADAGEGLNGGEKASVGTFLYLDHL